MMHRGCLVLASSCHTLFVVHTSPVWIHTLHLITINAGVQVHGEAAAMMPMQLARLWAALSSSLPQQSSSSSAAAAAASTRLFSSLDRATWSRRQRQRQEAALSGHPEDTSVPIHKMTEQYAYEDEGQAGNRLKFVSRERRLVPRPPFYRHPIYFPEVTLQMMKLSDQQRQQIRELGWTREVAFKTTPNMTKLEIKGILESMYGMQVEKVHTINYLGRKYLTYTAHKSPKRVLWRGDDWKKAYVIFKHPEGMVLPEVQEARPPMLQQLLAAKKLVSLVKDPHQKQQQQVQEGVEGEGGGVSVEAGSSPEARSALPPV